MFPIARTDDLLAGFYVAEDGRANPVDVTMSLAKGARMQGVTILEGVPATTVLTRDGAVAGVRTPQGDIECEYVVNCAGMWARELGERSGVSIPLQAAEHYYLITDQVAGIDRSWPVLEDPASYGYFREEVGGLMVGLFEPVCAPWHVDGIPPGFSFGTIPPDWERMGPFLEKAMARVPVSSEVGVRTFFCGPESFTPDLQPVVGEAPEVRNYFVAAGLNSIGILTGGGLGRRPRDLDHRGSPGHRRHRDEHRPAAPVPGEPRVPRDPDRRVARDGLPDALPGPLDADREGRQALPGAPPAARGAARTSRTSAGGRAPTGTPRARSTPTPASCRWGWRPWFDHWRAEHEAVRTGVGLMDMSFMSKFLVQGRDAGRLLERLSANRVNGESGVITYTQWLNEGGTLEADLTVTKLADDRFWVVASDTAHRHVGARLLRHIDDDVRATVTDVTSGYAQLNVQGPLSRAVMAAVTSADMSDAAFPFRAAREIDLGFARALCIRITYLGELGYELYVPAEQAVHAYDRLVAAGGPHGLRHAGLKALSSLRMEKAYRDYGHDIDNTDTVLEAGLGFAVDWAKPGGFIGREAALQQRAAGPLRRRLLQMLLTEPEPLLFHAEPVRRDGVPVGYVRAASYGWTLGGAVGLAMISADVPVDQAWCDAGAWEVEVAGRRVPATASLRPMYDPRSERVRG